MSSESGDRSIVVVGGGIVGLATAWTLLQRNADRRVEVLEKEPAVATHQTGRNSGVIHAGIYYKPGTLKATLCRRGKRMLEEFATRHGIPFERCGKLVVATNDEERGRLGRIEERARENGVECRIVDAAEAREIEPHVNAVEALHVIGVEHHARRAQVLVGSPHGSPPQSTWNRRAPIPTPTAMAPPIAATVSIAARRPWRGVGRGAATVLGRMRGDAAMLAARREAVR